ncbi:TrkH family potassium uptake protein [Gammaproteobacteria bacterium]|nr:TrkH family potassium uptake protein [Gammaproteobacteria bacterium]
MNLKAISNLFGILLMLFSLSFIVPISISLLYSDSSLNTFLITFLLVLSVGFVFWFTSKNHKQELSSNDGFIIITLFWLVLAIAGSLPFYLSGMSVVDSFFESMSGITTTGATVITNIDDLDKSLLMYRQLLQWMGGMGLIVLAIAVMPILGIGGGQIYKTEIPGAMSDQKLTPRITETAKALWTIYFGLTVLCALMYWIAGMNGFDAIAHSLSTVSIGGFSTHDDSIGFFNSFGIELVCIIFMIISASSFALHYGAIFRGRALRYFYDPEFRFFISIILLVFAASSLILFFNPGSSESQRSVLFQAVSIVSTTGFTTTDYSLWPSVIGFLLLIGAFIGGCSGSVGGGIKSWRILIMLNHAHKQLIKIIHPRAVVSVKIGSKVVDGSVAESVWGFFSIYVISFMLLLFALLATGLDFTSAFSAIGACLNNLGPGLGEVSANYSSVTSAGKGILAFGMILGRLEIFTVLVLFMPMFWRR